MDTSVSGGMAPALQSTNHQSTDLVNTKANGLKDILPQEKVNGKVLEDNDKCMNQILKTSESKNENSVSSSESYAACDVPQSIYSSDESMTVTESYVLTKHKEFQSAGSLSSVQIGQGDCPITHALNHNGWSSHKKNHSGGILQENNSTLSNVTQNGKELSNSDKKHWEKPSVSQSNMTCNSTNFKEVNENKPNGQIDLQFVSNTVSSTIADSRKSCDLETKETPFPQPNNLSAGDNSMSELQSIPPKCSGKPENLDETYTSLSACGSVRSLIATTKPMLPDSKTLGSNGEMEKNNQRPTVPHLPEALNYTDLLNSDLSKLTEQVPSFSHKLANTLQELAASLKGSMIQSDASGRHSSELSDRDCDNTVLKDDIDNHNSVKTLDFGTNAEAPEELFCSVSKEEELRLQSKVRAAVADTQALQKRMSFLMNRIDKLRTRRLCQHVRGEFRTIATSGSASKNDCKQPGEQHLSHCHAVETEDHVTVTELRDGMLPEAGKNPMKTFWTKILGKERRFEKGRCQNSALWQNRTNNNSLTPLVDEKPDTEIKALTNTPIKKEFVIDEQALSPSLAGINFDPIVQLTRVENTSVMNRGIGDLVERAKTNGGILEKELKYLAQRCDPDITDSSSDEDTNTFLEKRKMLRPSKSLLSNSSSNDKKRKSFCKWIAERTEVSKRWTWLRSRISNLEFSIRQQGELYRQLRNSKGAVQLDDTLMVDRSRGVIGADATSKTKAQYQDLHTARSESVTPATSPCNVNQLLNNVHYQTSKLFDHLSPLSGGSPSPNQASFSSRSQDGSLDLPLRTSIRLQENSMTAARTRPLDKSTFKQRKLVRLPMASHLSEKAFRCRTVPNDSAIMAIEDRQANDQQRIYNSIALKVAQHDHSYHTIISSVKDIPLSITMQAVMKSKRKWCKRSSSSRSSSLSRSAENKEKEPKHKRHKKSKRKRQKHKGRKQSKLSNSSPMLPPNHALDEFNESKRRRCSSQVSQSASESGRKRHQGMSFDSDMESSVVVGGFAHIPARGTNSGTSTPTHEISGQLVQTYWKKKKSSEQAYDINNIVIPHGLTSARIEKLAYKEIQTPSWKVVESKDKEQTTDCVSDETEDISLLAYQVRHDRYEILEKRKYMAYMEWSVSRKGRCSRMSNARGPVTPEPLSPSSPAYTPSPTPFPSEQAPTALPGISAYQTTTLASPTSPTAKPAGVRTRRMSTDQNQRASTPLSHLETLNNSNMNTSIGSSYSSPANLACWYEGLGSRRSSNDVALANPNRTISDSGTDHRQDSGVWEPRPFPLLEEDIRLLDDVNYALEKLREQAKLSGLTEEQFVGSEGEDSKRRFRPVSRQTSGEGSRPPYLNIHDHNGRSLSLEEVHDFQHSRSGHSKRRRTDSRASSLASHDDAGRHSDASNASASSSAYRRKRKASSTRNRSAATSQQRRDPTSYTARLKNNEVSSRAVSSRRKYLHLRLSETDDSSDTDSDNSQSSDDGSTSLDDAGHLLDDFADPEWDMRG